MDAAHGRHGHGDGRCSIARQGPPTALFVANVGNPIIPVPGANYAATSDGQRFLLNRIVRDTAGTSVRVVLNWTPRSLTSP